MQEGSHKAIVAAFFANMGIAVRSQHLGPDELRVAAKIEVDGGDSLAEVAQLIDEPRPASAPPSPRPG